MAKCTGLTEQMINQIQAQSDFRVNLKASQHELKLTAEPLGYSHDTTFMGTIAAPPESELTRIKVGLKVQSFLCAEELGVTRIADNAIGTMSLREYTNFVGHHVPSLIVCLRGENDLRKALARLIQNARLFGNECCSVDPFVRACGPKEANRYPVA